MHAYKVTHRTHVKDDEPLNTPLLDGVEDMGEDKNGNSEDMDPANFESDFEEKPFIDPYLRD